jgi:hypothetical protein
VADGVGVLVGIDQALNTKPCQDLRCPATACAAVVSACQIMKSGEDRNMVPRFSLSFGGTTNCAEVLVGPRFRAVWSLPVIPGCYRLWRCRPWTNPGQIFSVRAPARAERAGPRLAA